MDARRLIEARQSGVSFEKILHSVVTNRDKVSELQEDKLVLLEYILAETKIATADFESALKNDDVKDIRELAESIIELLTMAKDACNER